MKITSLTLFLLIFAFGNVKSQIDSSIFKLNLPDKIQTVSMNHRHEYWAIAGMDSSKIFRFDSTLTLSDKTHEIRRFTNARFASVLIINDNAALIGTKNDFVFFYNNGAIKKINKANGLSDSLITSLAYSPKSRRIYIETIENGFVSIDSTYQNYACFTGGKMDAQIQDSIYKDFKANAFMKYVYFPVKIIVQQLVPAIVEKGTQTVQERKISRKQIREIRKILEPGDILLKRDNGSFTNLVMTNFWTHTGIYIGNLREINKYFKGLALLNGMKPAKYIRKHHRKAYFKLLKMKTPIIEAVTKYGVRISPLKTIAYVDYFAALRPNLSKEDIFLALLKSLDYYPLPYNYDFDFSQTNAIVCSELIYKSFKPTNMKKGLNFELGSLLGSPFLYPGDIVKKYDAEYESNKPELDFILFYDSDDKHKLAFPSSKNEFRKTWKR